MSIHVVDNTPQQLAQRRSCLVGVCQQCRFQSLHEVAVVGHRFPDYSIYVDPRLWVAMSLGYQSAPTLASSRSRAQRWSLAALGDNPQIIPNALKERTHDR